MEPLGNLLLVQFVAIITNGNQKILNVFELPMEPVVPLVELFVLVLPMVDPYRHIESCNFPRVVIVLTL